MTKKGHIWTRFTSYLPGINTTNWKVMLLCLAGAATFWFFNSLNKGYNTQISYPVEFRFPNPDTVVVLTRLPDAVKMDVDGGGWNLFRKTFWFTVEPLEIYLESPFDNKRLTRRELELYLQPQVKDITLNQVLSDTLFLNIEPRAEKYLHLYIDSATLSLEEPYRLVSPVTIGPDSVYVSGAISYINSLPDTITLQIKEKNIDYNYREEISVNLLTASGLRVNPDKVDVSFDVEPFIYSTYNIPLEPVNFPNDSALLMSQSYISVSFEIRESYVSQLDDSLFQATADFNNLNRQDSTLIPRIVKRPGFVNKISFSPIQIKVFSPDEQP